MNSKKVVFLYLMVTLEKPQTKKYVKMVALDQMLQYYPIFRAYVSCFHLYERKVFRRILNPISIKEDCIFSEKQLVDFKETKEPGFISVAGV